MADELETVNSLDLDQLLPDAAGYGFMAPASNCWLGPLENSISAAESGH